MLWSGISSIIGITLTVPSRRKKPRSEQAGVLGKETRAEPGGGGAPKFLRLSAALRPENTGRPVLDLHERGSAGPARP